MFQVITKSIRDWLSVPTPLPERENQLSPELLQRIKTLQVKTNYLVNDIMAGEYVSAFKGRGMEFSEVREYQPGDDVRLIDWNVTARMNQPFIKEFIEERELTLMLLVDVSSSGSFGSEKNLKNEIAAEVASILAFAAIKNNDKIGLIIFTDQIEHYIPPKKGKGHVWTIIRTILSFKPKGKATNLSLPLEYLLKIQKKKATAFLISDFQDENYELTSLLYRVEGIFRSGNSRYDEMNVFVKNKSIIKIIIGLLFFLPFYGIILSFILKKIQKK